MQQFNLDWIMQQLHKMLQFMPMNGVAGDVLQRNVDGAVWMPLTSVSLDIHSMSTIPEVEGSDELAIYDNSLQGNYKGTVADILALVPSSPVSSVNGQTGAVVLGKSDVGLGNVDNVQQYSASNPPPYPVTSVNGQTGAVIVSGGAVDSVNGQTGTVVLGKSDVGLGNVDNVAQYSASNPPPYPVTSVNGMTGDVIVGGGGGGMDATLLWTNSSPADSFAAQTIAIDLSGYRFVLIEYTGRYFNMRTALLPCPQLTPPAGYSTNCDLPSFYTSGANFYIASRSCEVLSTGIVFNSAWRMETYGSGNTDNTVSRPTRIWGIA